MEESTFHVPTGIVGTLWTVFSLNSDGIIVLENHIDNQNIPTESRSFGGSNVFLRYRYSLYRIKA